MCRESGERGRVTLLTTLEGCKLSELNEISVSDRAWDTVFAQLKLYWAKNLLFYKLPLELS